MQPAGPEALGIELGADATVVDGWLVREFHAPHGLDGPPGVLQGGLAAGVTASIARAADRFGAPLTSVDARLHAPTPLELLATAPGAWARGASLVLVSAEHAGDLGHIRAAEGVTAG